MLNMRTIAKSTSDLSLQESLLLRLLLEWTRISHASLSFHTDLNYSNSRQEVKVSQKY